jgi:tellurite resistance protein TehA-like permease
MQAGSDMNAASEQLRWLEGLSPSNFALVMATGIISFAFDLTGQALLAQGLFGVTALAWVVLVGLSAWRLVKFPKAVKVDLLNIRRVFAFFTLVAATNVLGLLLLRYGFLYWAVACWALAFAAWSLLLYLSFSVLVFLTHENSVNVVHGDWLTSIIGTHSLVLLGAGIAPHLGNYAGYMMIEVHMLWGLGLIFYALFVTLFCHRIFFLSFKPEDTSPLLWVIMGAAAIGANAGTSLILADTHMPFLAAMRPFIDGVSMLLWAWATWWIPMLVIFGLWKHRVRHFPLRYEAAMWSMVFPLGMYAAVSYRFGLAADFPPLAWISGVMVWVAFSTWGLVMLGLLRTLIRPRPVVTP